MFPVALFGRARWTFYDAMSQGRAGKCQVSPRLEQEGRRRGKKRDLSKRVKSGLLHGLGKFRLRLWRRRRQSAHADAFAGRAVGACIVNRGACLHGMTWHGIVWSCVSCTATQTLCACPPVSPRVAWSQHDWPGLKDWVTAAGSSPLAAVDTASNRCRQCARACYSHFGYACCNPVLPLNSKAPFTFGPVEECSAYLGSMSQRESCQTARERGLRSVFGRASPEMKKDAESCLQGQQSLQQITNQIGGPWETERS